MVTVLLVDDDPLVRSGLRLMLGSDPAIEVVGEVGDGADVLAAVGRLAPDVVLMDVRMPQLDGVAATAALARMGEGAPSVLMLTTFGADATVVSALRAGASGYLLKDTPPEQILEAVRRVAAGEPAFSPAVTRSLVTLATYGSGERTPIEPTARERARTRLAALTERERDVACAVSRGLSNAEIAREMHLSASSVKVHLSAALAKLGLSNRVQVAILAHTAFGEDTAD
ncbi:response regulator [Ruania alba]|uniref:DNA-binding response regulator, NarL/FixJ family, contains REC and HTH domains n=1 Tax=Ruania alba TaxID=648782 RepID=A0A1H5H8A7_9MICO|nr:response regulator transcription factor [Ruania alba]SEE23994.1 DNA-binding response regulator, NarL/FixJ family, contains REC and HTH domains [Ruania alba]